MPSAVESRVAWRSEAESRKARPDCRSSALACRSSRELQVHRPFEKGAVGVRLLVGLVHRVEEPPQLGGDGLLAAEVAADLAHQEAVAAGHRQGSRSSRRVVMVIVWLCSSHLALGTKGEISPYE